MRRGALRATAKIVNALFHWAEGRNRNVGITSVLRRYSVGGRVGFRGYSPPFGVRALRKVNAVVRGWWFWISVGVEPANGGRSPGTRPRPCPRRPEGEGILVRRRISPHAQQQAHKRGLRSDPGFFVNPRQMGSCGGHADIQAFRQTFEALTQGDPARHAHLPL